jgi:hypothetical protein
MSEKRTGQRGIKHPINIVCRDAPSGKADTAILTWSAAVEREEVVYRAQFNGDVVNVLSLMPLDMKIADHIPDGDYALEDLPDWFRRRLDALAIISTPPPQQDIAGVGSRMGHLTYWVYR